MTKDGFLNNAYGLESVDKTRDYYRDWADTYDQEIAENGYATPGRCAAALAQFANRGAPVLDFGCGTGLSGLALKSEGFDTLDGCDLTPEMLSKAKDRGIYRHLWASDGEGPTDFSKGPYGSVAAIGVIGRGAAPLPVFFDITGQMAQGSHFVFSFNDHTMEDPGFGAAVNAVVDSGAFALLFREYGDHLPGHDMKSWVFVLEKR